MPKPDSASKRAKPLNQESTTHAPPPVRGSADSYAARRPIVFQSRKKPEATTTPPHMRFYHFPDTTIEAGFWPSPPPKRQEPFLEAKRFLRHRAAEWPPGTFRLAHEAGAFLS